jgi:hypothetical protein
MCCVMAEKICGGEDLKIAAGARVQAGVIDDPVGLGEIVHRFDRKGMAEDILSYLLQFGAVGHGHGIAPTD